MAPSTVEENAGVRKISSVGIIGNAAFTMIKFRGEMIRFLSGKGLDVYCFAPDYDLTAREEVRSLGGIPVGYRLSRTKIGIFDGIFSVFDLSRRLKQYRIDLVFSYFIKPILVGNFAGFLARVPLSYSMIEGQGSIFSDNEVPRFRKSALQILIKILLFFALRMSSRIFVLNDSDFRFSEKLLFNRTDSIVKISGIGMDVDYYFPHEEKSNSVRFVFCGRLLVSKGIREFAQAAMELRALNFDCEFIVIGEVDDNIESIQREELQEWHDSGVIQWVGFQGDTRPFFHRHTVLVLPTYYPEGLPRTIQESFAMACPVITTDAPGCGEYIEEGRTGYVVPERNADAIVAVCRLLIENPTTILKMGTAAREYAVSNFEVSKINSDIFCDI